MCFGLLGVNGAGKTSTLGMVTGEFPPSTGEAWLAQRSIMGQASEIKVSATSEASRGGGFACVEGFYIVVVFNLHNTPVARCFAEAHWVLPPV